MANKISLTVGEFNSHIIGLRCFAYFPLDSNNWFKELCFYFLFAPFVHFFVNIYATCSMFFQLFFLDSIDEIMDNIFLSVSAVLVACKGTINLLKRKYIYRILELSRDINTRINDPHDAEIMIHAEKITKWIHLFFWVTYVSTAITCWFPPLYAKERRLMFSAYFPFDWMHNDFNYWATYFYQGVTIILLCCLQSVIDTFCGCQLVVMHGYVRVLGNKLKRPTPRKCTDVEYLKQNMEYYGLIIQYQKCIEEINGYILMLQFLISGLTLCATAVLLTDNNVEFTKKVSLFFYMISMVIEILLPCLTATLVAVESDHLNTNIFQSEWYQKSPAYLKYLRIFRERLMQPVIIRLGGHFILGLSNFLAIVKGAYSLYAVLRNYN